MRYFPSRQAAGHILAGKIADKYPIEKCLVVCLSEGAVIVGLEIAKTLRCEIFLLVTQDVELPGELDPIGSMSSSGVFTYNQGAYPAGELESINANYHSIIEQNRMNAFQKLNRINSKDGSSIPKSHLKNHNIILVSDGLRNGLSLDVAADFLKPIKIKNLILATPIAAVEVVDKMHLLADKIFCLDVVGDFITTDHYYENNIMPEHAVIISSMEKIRFENQLEIE